MSPSLGSRGSNPPSTAILVALLRPAALLAGLVALLLASSAFAASSGASTPDTVRAVVGCWSAAWLAATSDLTQPLCPPPAVNQSTRLASTYLPRRPSACQVLIGPGTVLDRQWVYTYRRLEKRAGLHCDIVRLPANSRDELDGR